MARPHPYRFLTNPAAKVHNNPPKTVNRDINKVGTHAVQIVNAPVPTSAVLNAFGPCWRARSPILMSSPSLAEKFATAQDAVIGEGGGWKR